MEHTLKKVFSETKTPTKALPSLGILPQQEKRHAQFVPARVVTVLAGGILTAISLFLVTQPVQHFQKTEESNDSLVVVLSDYDDGVYGDADSAIVTADSDIDYTLENEPVSQEPILAE